VVALLGVFVHVLLSSRCTCGASLGSWFSGLPSAPLYVKLKSKSSAGFRLVCMKRVKAKTPDGTHTPPSRAGRAGMRIISTRQPVLFNPPWETQNSFPKDKGKKTTANNKHRRHSSAATLQKSKLQTNVQNKQRAKFSQKNRSFHICRAKQLFCSQ
jgi:hypothetical protein